MNSQIFNRLYPRQRRVCSVETLEPRRLFAVKVGTALFPTADGAPLDMLATDAAGNRYGITYAGTESTTEGAGAVFKILKGTHTIITLATLGTPDYEPDTTGGMVADPDGNVFFSTNVGIYEVVGGSNAVTQLHVFDPAGDNNWLSDIDENGVIYGTSGGDGYIGQGELFQFNTKTLAFKTFPSLNENDLITDPAGNLYGATSGAVYEIAAQTDQVTTVATIKQEDGEESGLVLDPAGDLFGVSFDAFIGNEGQGGPASIFEIAAKTHKVTTISTFNTATTDPFGQLYSDANGNIYGTETDDRDPDDDGSPDIVFEIPAGTRKLTTLATFSSTEGAYPHSDLYLDAAGNVYGTTTETEKNDVVTSGGSVFEVSATTHKLTTLTLLPAGNLDNPDALYATDDGALYGLGSGALFKLTSLPNNADPAQLVFVQQPKNTVAGKTIRPAVVADIEDGNGKIITTDDSTVSLTIASGPGAFSETTVFMVQAVHGVATFSDLQLSVAGHYILTAQQVAAAGANSDTFVIKPTG